MFNRLQADAKLAVIGLGYVGLPLAVEFGKKRKLVGFDINQARVSALLRGHDHTNETNSEDLAKAEGLTFTTDPLQLNACDTFIVSVPTPIDVDKRPDLKPLIDASKTVGAALKRGDVVIYESTVFPGATEEICVPVLEEVSGLIYGEDFFAGYSPERINPGDKTHRLPDIRKVTSGSTPEVAEFVDSLYGTIITAGTHKAESIKVAEAAKIIENTQRDLNIALVNELAIIFNKIGIDTEAVLQAAETKWNFISFRPGLVGGHCIGVDPFYLTHKAESIGYSPQVILAGRRLNDGMGRYVASETVKAMTKKNIKIDGARALVLGLSFKEDCPDIRNTKVIDIVRELADYNILVDVHDPLVSPEDALKNYSLPLVKTPEKNHYQAIILAVAHAAFRELGASRIRGFGTETHVIYDVKSLLPAGTADARL